jgi:hypothetical protein
MVSRSSGVVAHLTLTKATTEFIDADLDPSIDLDVNGKRTPHRIHGKGLMVYWAGCTVYLRRKVGNEWKNIRTLKRTSGQGLLAAGSTLVFVGDGGKVREG